MREDFDSGVTHATGGCLCGAVRFTVDGPLRPPVSCHCEQCRRTSGHYVSATACRRAHLSLDADAGLTWYRSSEDAERGFCRVCGGNLFYRPTDPARDTISIMAGTLDPPTGLRTAGHIFVAAKSDYYDLADALPRFADSYDSARLD